MDTGPSDSERVIGKCRLISKLGQGGMGIVHKAHHLDLHLDVAIKTLPSELAENPIATERFLREARLAARLNHDHAVRVLDCGQDGNQYYIVMEFVDGESLQDRLDREGALPPADAIDIAQAVAKALSAALDQVGLIHRDIKPDNIMLTAEGGVKVADFGLAKVVADQQSAASKGLTASGAGMGTPHYMPPEQIRAARDVDHRADIFALGATLYHMLAGKRPFDGDSSYTIMHSVMEDDPAALPESVAPGLRDLVKHMLAKKADDRVQTYGELLASLNSASSEPYTPGTVVVSPETIADGPVDTKLPTPSADGVLVLEGDGTIVSPILTQDETPPTQPSRRHVGVAIAGSLLSVATLTAFLIWIFSGDSELPVPRAQESEAKVAALLKTARTLRDAELPEKSREKIQEALGIVPGHPGATQALAEVQAVIDAAKAEDRRRTRYNSLMKLALDSKHRGRFKEAADSYVEAIAHAPAGSHEAADGQTECLHLHYRALGDDAKGKEKLQAAIDAYAKALEHKDDPEVQQALREVRADLELRQWLTKAREAEGRDDLRAAIGFYREAEKRGAKVAREIAALTAQMKHKDMIAQARLQMVRTNWKEAATILNGLLREKSDHKEARSLLSQIIKRLAPRTRISGPLSTSLVLVKSGEFRMGDSGSTHADEKPVHSVQVSSFYIGRLEVSKAQYNAYVLKQSRVEPTRQVTLMLPVVSVSWSEAQRYCAYLSSLDKAGAKYRLPTEAEWEFAARGKDNRMFPWGGAQPNGQRANLADQPDGYVRLAPIGRFPNGATPTGIEDLIGNAAEWCADWYGPYPDSKQTNPLGPQRGKKRVVRGSAFAYDFQTWSTATVRGTCIPTSKKDTIGFRVVRELTPDERKYEKLASEN